MRKKTDEFGKVLKAKASEYLGKPFSFGGYTLVGDEKNTYKVSGTVKRNGVRTKVEVDFDKETLEPRHWSISGERISMPSERIGSIELSEKACVTDPCYDRDVWCMTVLENVKPGEWDVFASVDTIDDWGERTYILELYNQSLSDGQKASAKWTHRAELGVDSGQISVFDDFFYRRKGGSIEAFEADKAMASSFYEECGSLSDEYAGIFYADGKAVGTVCSSGCGDGVYPLKTFEIGGQVVAMRISFM